MTGLQLCGSGSVFVSNDEVTMPMTLRVVFAGLGAMGAPMAAHLARMGLLSAVYNRTRAKAERFAQSWPQVRVLDEAAEAPEAGEVLVSCVSTDADVDALNEIWCSRIQPGQTIIDISTVSPTTATRWAQRYAACGAQFADAPISGGVEGAVNGRLSVMVGCAASTFATVAEALSPCAARITRMGEPGAGQATKAVNQVLVAGIARAVGEGLALATRLDLDPQALIEVLRSGAAQNWFLEKRAPTMLAGEYLLGFKLSLMHKDLKILEALAAGLDGELPTVQQALADYAELLAAGHGDEDISAAHRLSRRRLGLPEQTSH